ncbi:MAG: hypothetical protein AAF938_13230 [Myxococcota bacterium]
MLHSRWARFALFLVAGAAACGDDDGSATEAGPEVGAEAGVDAPSEVGDVALEADVDPGPEGTFLLVNRTQTPQGRFVLLNLLSNLGPQEVDPAQAREATGFSRVEVFNERVYLFDGESLEAVRFALSDDDELVEEDRFSFAGRGVAFFYNTFHFISPTRAYYLDLDEDRVIVFDPTAMAIVSEFDAPELGREDFDTSGGFMVQLGDEVYAAMSFGSTRTLEALPELNVVVLSASEDRVLRAFADARCGFAGGAFVDDGRVYVAGDWANGVLSLFGDEALPPPCLLRFGAGAAEFEADYYVDLSAATGRPHVTSVSSGGPGQVLLRVYDTDQDEFANVIEFFSTPVWRFATMDLNTGETRPFAEMPLGVWSFDPFVAGDERYVQAFDRAAGRTTLFRIASAGLVEGVSVAGDVQTLHRLR